MFQKLKSIFDSRYTAPIATPMKVTRWLIGPFPGITLSFGRAAITALHDPRDKDPLDKYFSALMKQCKYPSHISSYNCTDGSAHQWKAFFCGVSGITGAGAAAVGTGWAILNFLSVPLAAQAVIGLAAVPTAAAVGGLIGMVAIPTLLTAALTLAIATASTGAWPLAALIGCKTALFGKKQKATAPTASQPAPLPAVPATPPAPPSIEDQILQMTSEDRQSLLRKIKDACADDFEKAARPTVRPSMDVVPVYADLGRGKRHSKNPPPTSST